MIRRVSPPGMRMPQTLHRVARAYGFHLQRIEPLSSVYRTHAAFRCVTDKGDILIKPFSGRNVRLLFIAKRLSELSQVGYTHIPHWYWSRGKRAYATIGQRLYYVTQFVHGDPLGNTPEDLRSLGRALAALHAFPWGIKPKTTPLCRRAIVRLQNEHRRFCSRLTFEPGAKRALSDWQRLHGTECKVLGDAAMATLKLRSVQTHLNRSLKNPVWIHGDVTRPNTVVEPNGHVVLIDWERMKRGLWQLELAKAINNTSDFQIESISELLEGYQSVHPLSNTARQLVAALCLFPVEAWTAHKENKRATILRNTWDNRLNAARYLCEWADLPVKV